MTLDAEINHIETGSPEPVPTKDEHAKADFMAADKGQKEEVLKSLIQKKGYKGALSKPIKTWSDQELEKFYDHLASMPDANAAASPLPFE